MVASNSFKRNVCPQLKSMGIPSPINLTLSGDGFYVSFNPSSVGYGCQTTALVDDNMTRFFILNGDHRNAYASMIDSYADCLNYFKDNIDEINKYSDK